MECPRCHSKNYEDSDFCRICGSPLVPPAGVHEPSPQPYHGKQRELIPGSTFLGRYLIMEELGRGGMGIIYKAEDTKLRRHVALKFLPWEMTRDPEAKERFVHEAQAASSLDHPNICTVHDYPLLLRPGCEPLRLDVGGTVVGSFGSVDYDEDTVEIHPGDVLIAYSDGLTEVKNGWDQELGEARLLDVARECLHGSAEAMVLDLIEAAQAHAEEKTLPDDMTLVVAKRER